MIILRFFIAVIMVPLLLSACSSVNRAQREEFLPSTHSDPISIYQLSFEPAAQVLAQGPRTASLVLTPNAIRFLENTEIVVRNSAALLAANPNNHTIQSLSPIALVRYDGRHVTDRIFYILRQHFDEINISDNLEDAANSQASFIVYFDFAEPEIPGNRAVNCGTSRYIIQYRSVAGVFIAQRENFRTILHAAKYDEVQSSGCRSVSGGQFTLFRAKTRVDALDAIEMQLRPFLKR